MTPIGILFITSKVLALAYKTLLTLILIYILLKDFTRDEKFKRSRKQHPAG